MSTVLIEINDAPGDGWPKNSVVFTVTYEPGMRADRKKLTKAQVLSEVAQKAMIEEKRKRGWK